MHTVVLIALHYHQRNCTPSFEHLLAVKEVKEASCRGTRPCTLPPEPCLALALALLPDNHRQYTVMDGTATPPSTPGGSSSATAARRPQTLKKRRPSEAATTTTTTTTTSSPQAQHVAPAPAPGKREVRVLKRTERRESRRKHFLKRLVKYEIPRKLLHSSIGAWVLACGGGLDALLVHPRRRAQS